MSVEHKGEILRDEIDGELIKDKKKKGDLIISEGPKGKPLWRDEEKLNENRGKKKLNE